MKVRGQQLADGFDGLASRRKHARRTSRSQSSRACPYVLLHSLSHLLITAVSLDAATRPARSASGSTSATPGYGILLYTGTPDAEGTLGGLVEVARRIDKHLRGGARPRPPVLERSRLRPALPERRARGALPERRRLPRLPADRRAVVRAAQRVPRPGPGRRDRRRGGRRVLPGVAVGAVFHDLPTATLRALADAVRLGRLPAPYSSVALGRLLAEGRGLRRPSGLTVEVDAGLSASPPGARVWPTSGCRRAGEDPGGRSWSGPARRLPGAESRDTRSSSRELFAAAESSVLVSGFAVHQGKAVFEPLARRMTEVRSLKVRLFLNIARPQGNRDSESEIVRSFLAEFRQKNWPNDALPEVYLRPEGPGRGLGETVRFSTRSASWWTTSGRSSRRRT